MTMRARSFSACILAMATFVASSQLANAQAIYTVVSTATVTGQMAELPYREKVRAAVVVGNPAAGVAAAAAGIKAAAVAAKASVVAQMAAQAATEGEKNE